MVDARLIIDSKTEEEEEEGDGCLCSALFSFVHASPSFFLSSPNHIFSKWGLKILVKKVAHGLGEGRPISCLLHLKKQNCLLKLDQWNHSWDGNPTQSYDPDHDPSRLQFFLGSGFFRGF